MKILKSGGIVLPKTFWILIDISNSNPKSRNYLWWFETRKLAMEYKRYQKKMKYGASLSVPIRVCLPNK